MFESVLVGLSGGPDSVCLAVILDKLRNDFNLSLSAVYIDHGLRPDEVEAEREFCRNLCGRLGVDFHCESVNVRGYAEEKGLNKQEAARELRYRIFDEIAGRVNASKIALGHTADDQAELVLKEAGLVIKSFLPDTVEDYGDGKNTAVFDADKIKLPMIVRSRSQGDYFYPAGFGKKKKLQDYFVDEKVPKDERDAVPVIVSGDDIMWIVGYRADERFRAKEVTERYLVITINRNR